VIAQTSYLVLREGRQYVAKRKAPTLGGGPLQRHPGARPRFGERPLAASPMRG